MGIFGKGQGMAAALGIIALGVGLAGCGRSATEQDCQLIVDRLVEVELAAAKVVDPGTVDKRKEAIRQEMKGELKDCKGRRVSDRMMACVRTAPNADEVLACLR